MPASQPDSHPADTSCDQEVDGGDNEGEGGGGAENESKRWWREKERGVENLARGDDGKGIWRGKIMSGEERSGMGRRII